ncbi:MAG TPA: hypothetical protein VFW92_03080 [Candidatus Limnocylindrales bacterium]|nr:hypothetical protein [Candidatus Limnocylindrales bacterium]
MQTRQPYRHVQQQVHASAAYPAGVETGGEGGVVEEFVRFCRRRRRVGWPELYDEMCAVAGRGVFRGWGFTELAEHGISFTLSDMPGLAAIVQHVIRSERAGTSTDPSTVPTERALPEAAVRLGAPLPAGGAGLG